MNKQRLSIIVALVLLLCLFLVQTGVAQTGIGRIKMLWAERINAQFTSSQYPVLQVQQLGSAHAIDVLDSSGTTAYYVAEDGSLYTAGSLAVTGVVTLSGDLDMQGALYDSTGDLTLGDAVDVTGTLDVVQEMTVGGGYGDTGCTVSSAGVLQCNGSATTDGTLSALLATVGGGYGATGTTITAAGNIQTDGSVTIGPSAGGAPVLSEDGDALKVTAGGGLSIYSGATRIWTITPGSDANMAAGIGHTMTGVQGASISGGITNTLTGDYSFIGGGQENTITATHAFIGGGYANSVTGTYSAIAGGRRNAASGLYSSIAGGYINTASGIDATVAGGTDNVASGVNSTVAGGTANTASGLDSASLGGQDNTASGSHATTLGGRDNTASGESSLAAGNGATASHPGAFVWADSTLPGLTSVATDTFNVDATGGAYFTTAAANSLNVLTGNLAVGNGTPDTALDGEDAYVEGNAEIDGLLRVDGATHLYDPVTIHDGLIVTSTLDAYGAVSNSYGPFQVDDDLDVTGDVYDSAGDLTITDSVQITGSLDVLLPISDSGGPLMIDDDLAIVGGRVYDSSGSLTLDDDVDVSGSLYDSTGDLTLGDAVEITSTLDVQGSIYNSTGDVLIASDTGITGSLEINDTVFNSAGDVTIDDALLVTGNATVRGGLSNDAIGIGGALTFADDHIDVQGSLFNSTGDLTLGDSVAITSTLDVAGAISDSGSDLQLNDDVDVTGSLYDSGGDLVLGDATNITSTLDVDGNMVLNGTLTDDQIGIGGALTLIDTHVDVQGSLFDSTGDLTLGDAVVVTSTLETGGYVLVNDGDVQVQPDDGGNNAADRNELIGLPRIRYAGLGAGIDGTAEVVSYMDDSPDNEWIETAHVTDADDATYYKAGAASLRIEFAADAANDDGVVIDIVNDDLEANESVGFWLRSNATFFSTGFSLLIDDDTADTEFNLCAVTAVDTWLWCEIDISTLAGGTGDVVDKVGIILNDAASLGAVTLWIDGMYKWDADNEDALPASLYGYDAVLGVVNVANGASLAEYTDYFTHYQSGADALVYITNQGAAVVTALYAY